MTYKLDSNILSFRIFMLIFEQYQVYNIPTCIRLLGIISEITSTFKTRNIHVWCTLYNIEFARSVYTLHFSFTHLYNRYNDNLREEVFTKLPLRRMYLRWSTSVSVGSSQRVKFVKTSRVIDSVLLNIIEYIFTIRNCQFLTSIIHC